MKIIETEQNEIKTTINEGTQIFGPGLLWELAMHEKKGDRKEILLDLHRIICALNYGKVTVRGTK